jgi:hypothetical protein
MNKPHQLRKSHHIRGRQASKFFKAAKHSESQARSLNLFVTLNLSHTSCPEMMASIAMAEICGKFGRWLRHQSQKARQSGLPGYGAPIYETVIENPNGVHHAHWLVHVPNELAELFEKALPKWLSRATGGIIILDGAIKIKPIITVMALSRYCMKGVDPHHAKRCFVRSKDQGIVWGKRVSISRSLGPKARKNGITSGLSITRPI